MALLLGGDLIGVPPAAPHALSIWRTCSWIWLGVSCVFWESMTFITSAVTLTGGPTISYLPCVHGCVGLMSSKSLMGTVSSGSSSLCVPGSIFASIFTGMSGE